MEDVIVFHREPEVGAALRAFRREFHLVIFIAKFLLTVHNIDILNVILLSKITLLKLVKKKKLLPEHFPGGFEYNIFYF